MEQQANPESRTMIESILDINATNIWTLDEYQIAQLWEAEKQEDGFDNCEDKLLNTIRLAFEVVHYNHTDKRDTEKYETEEWVTFSHSHEKKGHVAIRRRKIARINDLTFENIKHISTPLLLELLDRNFGGGWDSIPLGIRAIIESSFDVTTTQLPTTRLHMKGGTLEKKLAAGFEVLEIPRGTWTEAIFAKKKELIEVTVDEGNAQDEDQDSDNDDNILTPDDEEYYSSYISEANESADEEDISVEDTLE